MMLQKEANFDLDRLLGYRETSTTTGPREDAWASLAAVTTRTWRAAIAGVLGVGVLLAVETGLFSALLGSLCAAVGLHYLSQLDSSEPKTAHTVTEREGMSEHDVWRYLILHDEHEKMKEDEAEKQSPKTPPSTPSGNLRGGR